MKKNMLENLMGDSIVRNALFLDIVSYINKMYYPDQKHIKW